MFKDGAICGACFQLIFDSSQFEFCYLNTSSIFVTATNFCLNGTEGGWCNQPKKHFDLSLPIFTKFVPKIGNVVQKLFIIEDKQLSFDLLNLC